MRWLLILCVLLAGCSKIIRETGRQMERKQAEKEALKAPGVDVAVKSSHPRLFIDEKTKLDPLDERQRSWLGRLRKRGDELIEKKTIDYDKGRMLTRSRDAMGRIPTLAGLYRITGEEKYADAAIRELRNVCGFRDWQPGDFLATAEMMTAVSIGYDWVFDRLSKADQKLIASAILEKGLDPALDAYKSAGGWTRAEHNWSLVCNGGVIVASLAVMDVAPERARQTLELALKSINTGLSAYDVTGSTQEGPMYHNYATRYLTFAAAALETAGETPIALPDKYTGWKKAGDYRLQMTGPTNVSANFGDSDAVIGGSAWLMWHGSRFNRPAFTQFETARGDAGPAIFDYIWLRTLRLTRQRDVMPLAAQFGSAVVLRSAWDDPNATFLAMRVGTTEANHTHLDLGSFVLDMKGQRIAWDLGADNYDLPGYLGEKRDRYLRSSTPGHNTLTVNDKSQPMDATARVRSLDETKNAVVIDLGDAYPKAKSATRTAALLKNGGVELLDEIEFDERATVIWRMHTQAEVSNSKIANFLRLQLNGVSVRMRYNVEGAMEVAAWRPVKTEPPQKPVEGVTAITLTMHDIKRVRITVRLEPE